MIKFKFSTDPATESDRILVWDGWRGCAILLVLCGHFYDIGWLWEDRMGVDVFFVLSGMLMSVILFEKRMSLRDFYIRRFSRIYPVFVLCVLTMFAVAYARALDFNFGEIIAALTFTRTYLPSDPHIWTSEVSIAHIWSLNIEEHAYVFLSMISLLFVARRFIAVGLLLTGGALVALSFFRYVQMPADEFKLYLIRTECSVVFILFSAGYGLLARQYKISMPPYVPILCVVVAFFCYANKAPVWLLFSVCPILLALAVNHLADMPALVTRLLSNTVLRYFGFWSYSIYLWQQFFFDYTWMIPGGKFFEMLLAIAVGATSYYLLEQPVRRAINKRWSPKPSYRPAVES